MKLEGLRTTLFEVATHIGCGLWKNPKVAYLHLKITRTI